MHSATNGCHSKLRDDEQAKSKKRRQYFSGRGISNSISQISIDSPEKGDSITSL